MVTTLDKFGRLIIPKKFREDLGINSNTALNISEEGNRIVIELVEDKKPLVKKNGILVFTGKLEEKKNSDFIKSDRNKRMRKLLTNKD
ncbi:MAG: AbrB/MazE/SpoVT family DNA-binding domain-containing protein [Melioribacteraceae bacterium]|nr:MAG: AbrB/MazE/SpoVT family DNA-binding domain-containing protein [Melioribacteraceae bacterium]